MYIFAGYRYVCSSRIQSALPSVCCGYGQFHHHVYRRPSCSRRSMQTTDSRTRPHPLACSSRTTATTSAPTCSSTSHRAFPPLRSWLPISMHPSTLQSRSLPKSRPPPKVKVTARDGGGTGARTDRSISPSIASCVTSRVVAMERFGRTWASGSRGNRWRATGCTGIALSSRSCTLRLTGLHEYRLQLRILQRAMKMLKDDGRIVYSTCSLNPVENEAVVAAALNSSLGL